MFSFLLRRHAPFSRSILIVTVASVAGLAQQAPNADAQVTPPAAASESASTIAPGTPGAPAVDKRIFGVLPNYRTAQDGVPYAPITSKQKFRIAFKDSVDWPGYFTSAAFAGIYQLENNEPQFGQGVKGYAKRYTSAYADQVIGNMLTEGALPVLLHEDPRYFRKATGSVMGRTAYAATRIFVTKTDKGKNSINLSELFGNSIAAGVSNLYYPDTPTAANSLDKFALQLATDAISNVLKEFWPDVKRKFFQKKSASGD